MRHIKPLFLVGAPRSGTTLARELVRLLDGVYLPPDEIQVIPEFCRLAHQGGSGQTRYRLLRRSVFAEHMRRRGLWPSPMAVSECLDLVSPADSLRCLVLQIGALEGVLSPKYWGDKTPTNIFAIREILTMWPDAMLLYIHRDPRDAVLSMQRAWGRSLARGATLWRDVARAGETLCSLVPRDQLRVSSFEEMVAAPSTWLSSLAEWLDVQFEPRRLEAFQTEERWGRAVGRKGVVALETMTLETPAEIIEFIEAVTFTQMRALGYTPLYASERKEISGTRLAFARVGDRVRSLYSYGRERGIINAMVYKAKQWSARAYGFFR